MILFATLAAAASVPEFESGIPLDTPLAQACQRIQTESVPDACAIIAEAAAMLGPTYDATPSYSKTKRKRENGIKRLAKRDYYARYFPTGGGAFNDLTKVFLAAKPHSNRLYIVIVGTESVRDWYENAKALPYTTKWRDGYYYTPPGHAGFRSGALNVIAGLLRWKEYRGGDGLTCPAPAGASPLTQFLCESRVSDGSGKKIELVIVGHSRGSAIATLLAPALDGWEITVDAAGKRDVKHLERWPLRLTAIVGFAPPYALYTRTDDAAGLNLGDTPNQWQVYGAAGVAPKMIMFYNDRDIVPQLSLGLGRQLGYRFRIGETPGDVRFIGYNSLNTVSLIQAHGSGGYCRDVMRALDRPADADSACDPRTYSEPRINERVGGKDKPVAADR